MLSRTWWAAANSGLWLGAGSAGITAALHDAPGVRVCAVIVAMVLVAGWTAHTLGDHYDEVTDENEMLHGQRHVVFGASEEATHALMREIPRAAARARRRVADQRRRRDTGPLPRVTARNDERWIGALSD